MNVDLCSCLGGIDLVLVVVVSFCSVVLSLFMLSVCVWGSIGMRSFCLVLMVILRFMLLKEISVLLFLVRCEVSMGCFFSVRSMKCVSSVVSDGVFLFLGVICGWRFYNLVVLMLI